MPKTVATIEDVRHHLRTLKAKAKNADEAALITVIDELAGACQEIENVSARAASDAKKALQRDSPS
jgi:hypothetical protein